MKQMTAERRPLPSNDAVNKLAEILGQLEATQRVSLVTNSDLLVRLWPEAASLAWLFKALALPSPKPGRSRDSRPALAWLWLGPWLGAGCSGRQVHSIILFS